MMVMARGSTVSIPSTASSPVTLQRPWITPNSRWLVSSLVFRINLKLHSKLSSTFWYQIKLLSLEEPSAWTPNCAAHKWFIMKGKSKESLYPLLKETFLFLWAMTAVLPGGPAACVRCLLLFPHRGVRAGSLRCVLGEWGHLQIPVTRAVKSYS